MHENGWFSIRSYSKTLYLQSKKRRKNILNQEFNPSRPNEVWVTLKIYISQIRITHINYIAVLLDYDKLL